jgi:hypothetical protein
MTYYVHQVPGRLRVKSPILKHQPFKCQRVVESLGGRCGIHQVRVNHLTGSVVVNYDPAEIDEERILNILEYDKLFDRSLAVRNALQKDLATTRAGKALGRAAFSYIVGRALESNGLSLLAAFI